LMSENKSYLDEFGLNDELMKLLLKSGKIEEFKTLTHSIHNPELIVKTLTLFQKEISKKENKSMKELDKLFDAHILEAILEKVGHEISSNDVKNVMMKIANGKPLEEALEKSEIDLKSEAEKILKEKPGLTSGAYMGLLMKKLKGQVSGKEVNDVLKELM